jgi:hypothetical protein
MWHVLGERNIQGVGNTKLKFRGLVVDGRIILKGILKNTMEECGLE